MTVSSWDSHPARLVLEILTESLCPDVFPFELTVVTDTQDDLRGLTDHRFRRFDDRWSLDQKLSAADRPIALNAAAAQRWKDSFLMSDLSEPVTAWRL